MIALGMRALPLALFVAACSSAPPPVAPTKPAPIPVAAPVPEPEPEPEPEPLATEQVAFEQRWAFVSPVLGSITAPIMPEDELVKRLPVALRMQYRAVEKAREKYRDAQSIYDDPDGHSRARRALKSASERAVKALEKALDKKPTAEVAIALSRLKYRHSSSSDAPPRSSMTYGTTDQHSSSSRAALPLERALPLTGLDDLGRWLRFELVHHLMATERAKEARPILNALAGVSSPDLVAHISYRLGLLHALEGDHSAAAASFRSAHAELAKSSHVTRATLLAAELLAHHRARRFDQVLTLAEEAFQERKHPAPVKPDPNPPPPPKPKPVAKRASGAKQGGILSVLGPADAVGLSSLLESPLGEREILRIATDAVERLELDPTTLKAPEDFRAAILSQLAVRALYRSDDETALSRAEAARTLGGPYAREALRVLRVLARRAKERERDQELHMEFRKLRWASGASGNDLEHQFLSRELDERDGSSRRDEPEKAPVVERNVRSLVRLCLEPMAHRLVEGELVFSAKVFADGRVDVQADAQTGALAEASACVTKLAARVLVGAPSSVDARVALKPLRMPRGGIWGDSIGIGGFGGLGSGSGIGGIGTGGGYGRGSGTGTIGIGSSPKPKPKKAPTK